MKDQVPQFALVHKLPAFLALKEVFFLCVAQLLKISRIHFQNLACYCGGDKRFDSKCGTFANFLAHLRSVQDAGIS